MTNEERMVAGTVFITAGAITLLILILLASYNTGWYDAVRVCKQSPAYYKCNPGK